MDISKAEFTGDLLRIENGVKTETAFFGSDAISLRDAKNELDKLLRTYAPKSSPLKDTERFIIKPVVIGEPEGSTLAKTDHITVFGENNHAVTFRKIPPNSKDKDMQRALQAGKQFMVMVTQLPKIAGK